MRIPRGIFFAPLNAMEMGTIGTQFAKILNFNQLHKLHTDISLLNMSEKFVGKWNLESSENFDDFMKEVGVNFLTRKAAGCVKPVLEFEVSNAGEHWKMTSTSTFTTWNCEFDLNKEFEVKTADGRTVKTIFAYENGKLTEKQSKLKDDEKDSYYERYIDESGKLVITMEAGSVKAKRVYTKAA
ncbi:hypothetical protein niasHT_006068 [Heterodera trifolii]|uniref:Cytosolic fatty-acid binding proteins domain-containing protein n=3 Tax=Heterodera TaxID=34509 RepID=A0ABD2M8U5_9BILA